jgi:hypothetical protein
LKTDPPGVVAGLVWPPGVAIRGIGRDTGFRRWDRNPSIGYNAISQGPAGDANLSPGPKGERFRGNRYTSTPNPE